MAEPEKKLFLLDAFALIYRAYYAFINNPRINSKGLNTSAILGFTNTLIEVIQNQKPTHIAVVFDTPEKTVRHVEFPEYKANREAMPEDIGICLPYIDQVIQGFNIPIIKCPGFEADDVIGTLAKKAEKEGFVTYMMTPDKDFGQLVSENIFMFKPARSGNKPEVLGVLEVCEKYEISDPLQLIDILGMWGDSVDNIPGIPGIGEKTAKKLVGQFGSMEGLLENTDQLKGKLKEKVEANIEQAILSKKLATILLDAPVEIADFDLTLQEPNKEYLKDLFTDLEFRQLAKRFLDEEISVVQATPQPAGGQMDLFTQDPNPAAIPTKQEEVPLKNIENTDHKYHVIDTLEGISDLIEMLSKTKSFCFDTETTSLDTLVAEMVGMSFAVEPHQAYFVPIPEDRSAAQAILNLFKPLLEDYNIEKIGQNIKYDISVLKNYGIQVDGKIFDTMLAHYILAPDMNRRNMSALSESYLNYTPVPIENLIGKKGKSQLTMRDVPIEQLSQYAAEDADVTLQLKEVFEPMLKDANACDLYYQIETPLVPVLSEMEAEGITIDTAALSSLSKEVGSDIKKVEKIIHDHAGEEFNVSSPRQVGEILFEKLKITDKAKKTKSGQYATGEEVLSKLIDKHPIVDEILNYRELVKLKNTYIDPLPTMISEKTGRVHTSFNQVVAATGRLSSDNPNLQNIPIRTTRGKEIRKAFIAKNKDHVLLCADYSQIELRIIAELSRDEGMIEAFTNSIDIHSATASKVYNVDLADVTSDMRRNAKMVNFGIIYGISAFGLSQRLNIPRNEAKEIIEQYFSKYPGVKAYMEDSVDRAKQKGYVETIMGRRRYLRDINSGNAIVRGFAERNAINAPIQGSAADMIKIAMINISKIMKAEKYKSKMLLQVHDELVFDAVKNEVEALTLMVKKEMSSAMKMNVPIEVEVGTGNNWLEAH